MNWKEFNFFKKLQNLKKKEEGSLDDARSESRVKGIDSAYETIVYKGAVAEPFGDLSYAELREVYLKSSSVRPCVDTLSRYISSLPWDVKPKPGSDPTIATQVKEFLLNPNSNKESLRYILQKVLVDVFVLDTGIIEKVKSRSGNLLELYARDGATFTPDYDIHGVLQDYRQNVGTEPEIMFKPDEIVHIQLYPRTNDFYGTPIISTITDEVATLMFSMAEVGDTFTKDEIPPGFLALEGLGDVAFRKLIADITSEKGLKKQQLRVLRNVKAEWIDLKRSFKEMEVVELTSKIETIVRRNFGIRTPDMDIDPKFVKSVTQTLNYYINQEIIKELSPDVYFKMSPLALDEKEAKARESMARAMAYLTKENILEPEVARRLVDDWFPLPEEALD